ARGKKAVAGVTGARRERVAAGTGAEAGCVVGLVLRQFGDPAEAGQLFPAADLPLQVVLRNFGIEIADPEFRNLMLLRERLDDRNELVDTAIAARVPGRSDHQRYAPLARLREKQLQLFSHEVPEGDVLAQIDRARIG